MSETLTWQDLGQIKPPGDERGLSLGFDGGYLAATYADATVWYSPDGIAWQSTAFGGELPFCPGEGAGNVPEVSIEGMAADGRQVVLVLRHIEDECYDPSGEDTFVNRLWLSDDGQSWQQSEALDLWAPIAVAGGWEAFAVTPAGLVRWTSADGHSWQEAGPVMGAPEGGIEQVDVPRAWSSSTGVRMLAVLDPEPFEIILLASNDGEAWTEVAPDGDALDGGFLHTVAVALIDGQDKWLVVYDFEGEPSRLLSSVDLASWQAHELLDLEVRQVSGSSTGFLVTAQPPCPADFGCDPEEQRQFLSRDGLSWSEITPSIFSVSAFADGPAGVIALGSNDPDWSFTDPVEVWRLGR